MTFWQELRAVIEARYPEAVCLGGACYLRLGGGDLAKAEPASTGGYYDGIRLTVLNRLSGPVDALTIHIWDLPREKRAAAPIQGEGADWGVCRPAMDVDALWELAEKYLCLFREPDPELRR